MGTILYRGEHHQVPFEVERPRNRWWRPGDRGARWRAPEERIRAHCIHWSAAENGADRVYATLRNRGLSYHALIDNSATVYQWADPGDTVTYHAGKANGWTFGTVVVCRGIAPALRAVPRPEYIDRVKGKRYRFLRFSPAQTGRLYDLSLALSDIMGIPWQVPTDEDGELLRRTMTSEEQAEFRGILGHYHVRDIKLDPGTAPLVELASRASLPQG